jgi:hypothetical protein
MGTSFGVRVEAGPSGYSGSSGGSASVPYEEFVSVPLGPLSGDDEGVAI